MSNYCFGGTTYSAGKLCVADEEVPPQPNPEKHLLSYVLERAVRDLYEQGEWKKQAVRWFTTYKHGVIPFCDVAAYLDLSKDRILKIHDMVSVAEYQLGIKKCGQETKLGL